MSLSAMKLTLREGPRNEALRAEVGGAFVRPHLPWLPRAYRDSFPEKPKRVTKSDLQVREGGVSVNLQPLGDRLIVEALEEEEVTVGGIVLPDTAKEKPQRGKVLAVGPGARNQETGEYIQMDVAEGDEIIFSKYGGTEIKLGTDDVLILRETDVLAKVVNTGGKRKRKLAGATT